MGRCVRCYKEGAGGASDRVTFEQSPEEARVVHVHDQAGEQHVQRP